MSHPLILEGLISHGAECELQEVALVWDHSLQGRAKAWQVLSEYRLEDRAITDQAVARERDVIAKRLGIELKKERGKGPSVSRGLHIHGVAPNLWRKGPGIRLRIPSAWRKRIIRLCGETCQYCGHSGDSTYGPDWYPWHLDHIVSIAEGGETTLDNLTLACQHCNLSKGSRRWRSGRFAR